MLSERSKQIRRDTYALSKANGGYHYGGSFSTVEILIALFDKVLKSEDVFILSKGHACWPYYVLLREQGLTPKLEGHPVRDPHNGVHCTTGSLGHGFPIALGMAIARKIKGLPGTVYVLMGDGECQEGTTWESILLAGHHNLDNLVVIIDNNGVQGSGYTAGVASAVNSLYNMSVEWDTEIVDGHNIDGVTVALLKSRVLPKFIFAETIKGRGVSFMEDDPAWHAKYPNAEEEARILEELK